MNGRLNSYVSGRETDGGGEFVKFTGANRAALLAAAVVTEVAGLGLAVLPAMAVTPLHGGSSTVLTISGGGDRTSSNSVSGTGGVRFSEQHANPSTCTTASNGKCTLTVPYGDHRVSQTGAPAGWFLSPQLGISPNSYSTHVVAADYSSVTTNAPHTQTGSGSGIAVPSSTSGTTTNPYAQRRLGGLAE
jgi:hypothetical protein